MRNHLRRGSEPVQGVVKRKIRIRRRELVMKFKGNSMFENVSRGLLATIFSVLLISSQGIATAEVEENLDFGQAIPLTDLLVDGSSFVNGDKEFSEFGWTGAFDASGFSIVPYVNTVNGNLGFQIRGAFLAHPGELLDQVLTYKVEVLDLNFLISDVHLDFNGVAENGIAVVTETVRRGSDEKIEGLISVNSPDKLSDQIILKIPERILFIEKDIVVATNGDATGNFSTISIIGQEFSQIPEPSTVMLVAGGLVGLCVVSRRRRS